MDKKIEVELGNCYVVYNRYGDYASGSIMDINATRITSGTHDEWYRIEKEEDGRIYGLPFWIPVLLSPNNSQYHIYTEFHHAVERSMQIILQGRRLDSEAHQARTKAVTKIFNDISAVVNNE